MRKRGNWSVEDVRGNDNRSETQAKVADAKGGGGQDNDSDAVPCGKAQLKAMDRLRMCAAEQRCVIAHGDSDRKALYRLCKKGLAVAAVPGVFCLRDAWEGFRPDERIRATALAYHELKPNCVFCGTTAAVLHGLPVSWRRLSALELIGTGDATAGGELVIRHVHVREFDLAMLGGIRLTTIDRTLLDCANSLDFPELLAMCDAALAKLKLTRIGFEAFLQHRYWHCRGITRLLQTVRLADARSESAAESFARADCLRAGMCGIELQVAARDLMDSRSSFRIDMVCSSTDDKNVTTPINANHARAERVSMSSPILMCEIDGRSKTIEERFLRGRTTAEALQDERMRESHLSLYGERILRFSAAETMRPSVVSSRISRFAGVRISFPENPDAIPKRLKDPPIMRSYLSTCTDGVQVVSVPYPLERLRREYSTNAWKGWVDANNSGCVCGPSPNPNEFELWAEEWRRAGWYP